MQNYKWIGLNRQNKEGGGIGFLINKSIIQSCTIDTNLNKTFEFMSVKLSLTNNQSMMFILRQTRILINKKNKSENEFNQISTYTKNRIDSN